METDHWNDGVTDRIDGVGGFMVLIGLTVMFWSACRRRWSTWAVVWRPDLSVPTSDSLTLNHHGQNLDAGDSTMADDGNRLKFSFAAKIYGSYRSPLYIYGGVSCEMQTEIRPDVEIRLPQVKIRLWNRVCPAVARAVRLVRFSEKAENHTSSRHILQNRHNDGKYKCIRIKRRSTRTVWIPHGQSIFVFRPTIKRRKIIRAMK